MNERQQLEMLSESIGHEVDDLQSVFERFENVTKKLERQTIKKELSNIISNLNSTNSSIYQVFEETNDTSNEEIKDNYNLLVDILKDKLSYDEKTELRIKYNIEI